MSVTEKSELPVVVLTRKSMSYEGTFGKIEAPGFTCFTGELPWKQNRRRVSSIPEGSYKVIWAWSPAFRRYTYRLLDVPGRDGVLIHSANFMGDTTLGYKTHLLGCIALGERIGYIGKQKAILVSRPAVSTFERIMGQKPFTLEIKNV